MILITGCTGFVGSTLVPMLKAKGHIVTGLVRTPNKRRGKPYPDIPMMSGSIMDPTSLERTMKGVDTVIHLVGILLEEGTQSFEAVHHQGTRNVLEAAEKAGVKRYLHMSSLGTREHAASQYHQSKWDAECAVRDSKLDWTILRPSVIFGRHDNFVNQFINMAKFSPALPLLGDGSTQMQPIWVEDVARCFIAALDKPESVGKVYELGGPDRLTFKEILQTILQASGKRRLLIPTPFTVLEAEAWVMERVLPTPPLTQDQLIMAQEDNICDIQEMCETFEVAPRTFRDGLNDYNM
ncbi:MAG: complex I NDUFA9 subunit family protein [Magnetococcales bacterium]|nr:complex I NDUFA9 subunit family protein [Magnetococcales bacterium]